MQTMSNFTKPEQLDDTSALAALAQRQFDRTVLRAAFDFRAAAQAQLFALAREQRERFSHPRSRSPQRR